MDYMEKRMKELDRMIARMSSINGAKDIDQYTKILTSMINHLCNKRADARQVQCISMNDDLIPEHLSILK